jgi:hypothetical protein
MSPEIINQQVLISDPKVLFRALERRTELLKVLYLRRLRTDALQSARAYRACSMPENATVCVAFAREQNRLLVRLLVEFTSTVRRATSRSATNIALLRHQAE